MSRFPVRAATLKTQSGSSQLKRDFNARRAEIIVVRLIHAGNCKRGKNEMSAADKDRGKYPDVSAKGLVCRVHLGRQLLSQRC